MTRAHFFQVILLAVHLLMAIISHFDRQLLGNKLSFILCSIHVLLKSNEFHMFWMSFDSGEYVPKMDENGENLRPPGLT